MIEQIESIFTCFDKVGDDEYFLKETITKIKPFETKIDFQHCHIAISQNGGLVAFVKKHNVFLISQSDPLKENVRIFTQNGGKEIRIPFKNDMSTPIVLFSFTKEEKLIGILSNGTIIKFDISTRQYNIKKTGTNFQNDYIERAKLFEKGFVALTYEKNFYIVKSIKEPFPYLFFPLKSMNFLFGLKADEPITVSDFLFLPPDSTESKKVELLFPCPKGHGVVHLIDPLDNKFDIKLLPLSRKEETMVCDGVNYIRENKKEQFIQNSGKDEVKENDLGVISAFALSPNEEKIAMYRRDGTVFWFDTLFRNKRTSGNFAVNEKDSDKDKQAQKNIIDFAPNTKFLFCGDDGVCLIGQRFIMVLTESNKPITYKMSNKVLKDNVSIMECITEVDGLRIITNDAVFLLGKVSQEMHSACYMFSNDSSKQLISAYKSADEKFPTCDKEIRDILEELPIAVKNLQIASANLWKKDLQSYMLKAAQYGKNFVNKDEFNFMDFVERCKDIRVINNLRNSDIPRYITFTEYKKIKKKELVKRLMHTEDFYMAFEISKYLGMSLHNVYQKFAIVQIKKLSNGLNAEEEIEHYNILQKKLQNIQGISYIKLAEKSFKYKKNEIGMKFLENEKSILTKIPQYVELGKWGLALELAFETYDTNVFLTVINKMIQKEGIKGTFEIMKNYDKGHSSLVEYLKQHYPVELKDYLEIKNKYDDLFFLQIENFFNLKDVNERRSALNKAEECLRKIGTDKNLSQNFELKFYSNYLEDLKNSVTIKGILIQENKFLKQTDKSIFDNSIYDVVYESLKVDPEGGIEKKVQKFDLSKTKINLIRLRAIAQIKDVIKKKRILQTYQKDMKSMGLQPIHFAEIYLKLEMKDEACKMINLIKAEEYFHYKVAMLRYMGKNVDALEVIIAEKDQPRKAALVNEILQKFPDLKQKVEELKVKYKVNF